MANKIKDAYVRHYTDNGQTTFYVEWQSGGRSEAPVKPLGNGNYEMGMHAAAWWEAAKREAITIRTERW